MQIFPREQQAIDTYFSLLIKKGATFYQVAERLEVLVELTNVLQNKAQSIDSFTDAVEKIVSNKQADFQHYFRKVAQEFFVFWMGDAINITLFKQHYSFDFESGPEATLTIIDGDLKSNHNQLKRKAKSDALARHFLNTNSVIH